MSSSTGVALKPRASHQLTSFRFANAVGRLIMKTIALSKINRKGGSMLK
jgi:hypothetical protein